MVETISNLWRGFRVFIIAAAVAAAYFFGRRRRKARKNKHNLENIARAARARDSLRDSDIVRRLHDKYRR